MNRFAFLKSIIAAFLAPFVVKKATPSYVNEATIIPAPAEIIEVSVIQGDRFNVYELNTVTGEKKLLRSYPTKDLIA